MNRSSLSFVERILTALEANVDERVQDLEELQSHSYSLLRYLKKCTREVQQVEEQQREKEDEADAKVGDARGSGRDDDNKQERQVEGGDTVVRSSLEDILAKAKVMREAKQQATTARVQSAGKAAAAAAVAAAVQQPLPLKPAIPRVGDSKSGSRLGNGSAATQAAQARGAKQQQQHQQQQQLQPQRQKQQQIPRKKDIVSPSLYNDLQEQLNILASHHHHRQYQSGSIETTSTACLEYGPNKELYSSQAGLLSRLADTPVMPMSIAFELVERERFGGGNKSSSTRRMGEAEEEATGEGEALLPPAQIETVLKRLQGQYERLWKSKLDRVPVTQLGASECKELLTLWYKSQRLLQIYSVTVLESIKVQEGGGEDDEENEVGSGGGSGGGGGKGEKAEQQQGGKRQGTEEERIVQLMRDLVIDFPRKAPAPNSPAASSSSIGGSGGGSSSSSSASSEADLVADFHASFQSRVQYIAETVIGKFLLKDVLRLLRSCCENAKGGRCSSEQWIEALKAYRDVYCCLVSQSQDANGCIFINKK